MTFLSTQELAHHATLLTSILALAFGGRWLLLFITRKWLRYRGLLPPALTLERNFTPLYFLFFCVLASLVLPEFHLSDPWDGRVAHALHLGTILSTVWFLDRVMKLAELIVIQALQSGGTTDQTRRRMLTQVRFIYRLASGVLLLVGFALCLLSFPRAREFGTSLLASAGLASVVIGFAAQKSIGTLIAGFQIVFTQVVRLDDIVFVENQQGTIEEITLTHVIVKLGDLRRLVLPITYFIEKPFENWTRTSSDINGTLCLYVDFRTPVEPIRAAAQDFARASRYWDQKTFSLRVTDITAQTVELKVTVGARNASDLNELRCELRERLLAFISQKYAQFLPRMRSEAPVSVG